VYKDAAAAALLCNADLVSFPFACCQILQAFLSLTCVAVSLVQTDLRLRAVISLFTNTFPY
jgi:K+-transporting ATPase A subunit